MLFHWDTTQAWKYHDLRLMPFPSSSSPTLQESRNSASRAGPPLHSSLDLVPEADQIDSNSDDSYWDSYGAAGHDLPSPSRNASMPDPVGEDAYWAQYASVQGCYFLGPSCNTNSPTSVGSADSTVPSPLPVNRKLRPVYSNDDNESVFPLPPQSEPIIDVPVDAIHSRLQPGPPPPNMLANLLSTISPRKDIHFGDPYSSQSPSAPSTDPSPEQTTADSELLTPPFPDEYLDVAVVSPVAVEVNGVPSKRHPCPLYETEDKALTESIKGLYYLWKSGRKCEPDARDKTVFLQIVQEAVAYE